MCFMLAVSSSTAANPARGPLRVCPSNPRYFSDSTGRAIYLTGSHTWDNLKDMGPGDPPPTLVYEAYLDFLTVHSHNFIRLWTWEQFRYQTDDIDEMLFSTPFPWPRTGPGNALDGKPRFNLSCFDQSYFDRLHSRVKMASERGIYVAVMLFEGWGLQRSVPPTGWHGHPFHPGNNINGIDGDPDGSDTGIATNTLAVTAVTRIQEAYVKKVIDTVSDLDNVLYEICNEAGPYSTEWQYHMIKLIKSYEAGKPKQHPVGMTFQFIGGNNETLFESPADWISPNSDAPDSYDYRLNPPPATGRKVIITDTDHLGAGDDQAWVWKSFCRGLNPIFMDPYLYVPFLHDNTGRPDPQWEPIREAMGHTRKFAERMYLTSAEPASELSSSGYCLAVPGQQYLVYLPEGGRVTVDLTTVAGQFEVEWFNPRVGKTVRGNEVSAGGIIEFTAPFTGDAVLFIFRP